MFQRFLHLNISDLGVSSFISPVADESKVGLLAGHKSGKLFLFWRKSQQLERSMGSKLNTAYRNYGDKRSCTLRRYFVCADSKLNNADLRIVL